MGMLRVEPEDANKNRVVCIPDGSNCKLEDFPFRDIDISVYRKAFIA